MEQLLKSAADDYHLRIIACTDMIFMYDLIVTFCVSYTNTLLSGGHHRFCCYSNLTQVPTTETVLTLPEAEPYEQVVLNVLTSDSGRHFMKASPARPGIILSFF